MNLDGSFGNWLKQRRKALDLTQADLADQVGCSITTIRKIEADSRRPSKQISERMADVLVVMPEDRAAFIKFARQVTKFESPLVDNLVALIPAHNLPPQSTPFIGRENELAQIADRLDDPACRLLTLVGPGGIGKTRLALQAASDRVGDFADGVYFVSLTPVGATSLIASAIANALHVSFYGQESPNMQIVNYLRGKHILLVLDNYEHLLAGIDLLTDLLANAPRLKLLVTSRERLNMHEEWVLPTEGLPFPAQGSSHDASHYSAVQLFLQTAHRVEPRFALEGNEDSVADICRTVEGMPLAIELAATWLRVMPCSQIAGQIRRDLDFLTTPLRNVAERHRSLRAVFEHSWELLSEHERDVLMKLSVFRGGCDLEAAESVAEASLWLLAGLMDKSLVRLNNAGRYEMHELLRQFAADKLLESGQSDSERHRHLQFFMELAERLEPRLFGSKQIAAWDRLGIELDNFRAALDWALRTGDSECGLRLAGALGWFWNRRTHWTEGRKWLEMFRAADGNKSIPARAKAFQYILELSVELGDLVYARVLSDEALALVDEVEDQSILAWLLSSLGLVALFHNDLPQAKFEQALALFRKMGDQWGICETLLRLAIKWMIHEDFERAGELQEEGIKLARQAGDKSVLSWLLWLSASRKRNQGITGRQTEDLYRESLSLFSELGHKNGALLALHSLGIIAYSHGDDERAGALFAQSLRLAQQVGNKSNNVGCLVSLAGLFSTHGKPMRAARILGAVDEWVQKLFGGRSLTDKFDSKDYERALTNARTQLGEAGFEAAYAEGQMMTLDQAVDYALSDAAYLETE